ncbi:type II toxin-antitoxin system HigB family toxin [Vibrio rarus]|uniref:type II toxin-antitoxin system HigB family toxin n=1 Tax=Vibrio rarus TaxID=413403 RepID=UPI0021C2AB04|nr:type II toxin-antitoxin system HigB family toxin [Vibrio rarus]
MKLLGRDKLEKYIKKHADAKKPLLAWQNAVLHAEWENTHDVKERFSSADFLGQSDNRVIFNIKGNHHRLVVKVRYGKNGMVVVEWVETHAEYSKKKFN